MAYITKKQTNSGVKPIGSNLFGSCSTASGTAAKVVAMPDFDVLVEGVTIHVHFDNGNTASSPTLKVGSTDAKPIVGTIDASGVYSLTYHSGSWYCNDNQSGGGGHTYGLSINGTTLQIVEDGGSPSVTIPDDDTTYTISING
ncbi:MAG: hypothetical protein U0L88_07450, partial [Acutalibacteraceae bacterium]|nr:hypothetical protein [Acutalibacteraceae bacterium]